MRLVRQRKTVAVRHHRDRRVLRRFLDMHIARFIVLGFRAVAFMLIDELHIAGVVVNRDLMRIVLLQDALVCLQSRDAAVHSDALFLRTSFLLMMVAGADLLMLPRRAIGEQHGNIAWNVAPLLRLLVNPVDIGRYHSFEEGVLVVQSQDDVSVALRADVARDPHGTRLRCCDHIAVPIQLGIDEHRAVIIRSDGCHITARDRTAADGDLRAVRLDGTPHLRVDVYESLDIDLRTAHILACLDRAKVFTVFMIHADSDSMCRIVVVFDHELRMSMTAIVSRTARITHDEDAASVEAALRIGLDIHALDILDRERAAVDGDGIRRALPTGLRTLVREKTMSAGTRLDVETMPRHIDRAFDVAVPIDRTELIVLHRDDRLVRRLYFKLDVMMERVVTLAIVDTLFLPEFLHGFHIVVISFSNLLLDRAGCRRRCRIRFYMGASVGVSIVKIHLLRDGRAGQPFGDHRFALEVALPRLIAVIVELSGKRIERLAHGILIAQVDAVAVRHHRDRGVLRRLLDMRIAVALVGIYIRRIAAIVLRPRSVIAVLIMESQAAGKAFDRKRFRVILEDLAVFRFQMCDIAAFKVCRRAAFRHIVPVCAIGKIKSRAAILNSPADAPLDIRILRHQRCAKGAAIEVIKHDVAFHLHIAVIGHSIYTVAICLRVDVDLAPIFDLHGTGVITFGDESAAANAYLAAVGMEEFGAFLLDVRKTLDCDVSTICACFLRHDSSRHVGLRRIADLDGIFLPLAIFDMEFRCFTAAACGINGTRALLVAADADVYRTGIFDLQAATL